MATVDLYVWKRPAKDGKYPISVRYQSNFSFKKADEALDNVLDFSSSESK